jgi:hypothetical protein
VDTTQTTLKRIVFNQISIYEALKQLADLSGFYFFVDQNKDLNFKERSLTDSGVTIDPQNVEAMVHDNTREGMANHVWVYGDRYLAGFKEVVSGATVSSTPGLNGSVLTLLNKPFNTQIESSNSPGSVLKGGIFEITNTVASGVDYLVSFHDRELIFVSGTEIGYSSIIPSGGSIIANYDRELPIVKEGLNRTSIDMFGEKTKVINDKSIRDPNTAVDILNAELAKADPFRRIEADLHGWFTFLPGQLITVNLGDFNLTNQKIPILSIRYTFDANTVQSEEVIRVKLDKKVKDITDELTDIRRRVEAIESQDRQDTDVITRLETGIGSLVVLGSQWKVDEGVMTGSVYHLYATNFTPPINPFHLASGTNQAALAGSFTGSAQAIKFTTVRSGGFDYATL